MEDEDDLRATTAMPAATSDTADELTYSERLPHPVEDLRIGPGVEVGGYRIDAEVGKGGMGNVYSATHPVIGKRAAIKVLRAEVSNQPIVVERFIQEARAVNQIGHPNIIDIFAFGTLPDGRAYHIMDLLEGESLRRRIKRGPIHPSEVAAIIGDVASALTAAHDKGFVHRDLKPDNVFLVQRAGDWPEVKLLDFGLAKLMPEAGISPFTTKTGVMLGTPEYMSPEQARGTGVDYRTDIYALGILTFELLARQRPFPSRGDPFATMQAHIEELPPSLRGLVSGLPDELVQLVEAMLAKDPAARPSLAAVRNVIKRLRSTALPSRTEASLDAAPIAPPVSPRMSGLATDDAAATVANLRRVSTPPTAEGLPPTSPMRKRPSGAAPSLATPPVPSYQSLHVVAASSAPGRDNFARTRLGVAPAKAPTSPPSFGQLAAPAPDPAPAAASQLWLLLGAVLAIAAGIAIAIVLVAVG